MRKLLSLSLMKKIVILLLVAGISLYLFRSEDANASNGIAKADISYKKVKRTAEEILHYYRKKAINTKADTNVLEMFPTIPMHEFDGIFKAYPEYKSDGFDFPVGKPNAKNYFKAQQFGETNHLGEDWNGIGGGNTDLGDPVYSISHGLVTFSQDVCCGWGNVIRVIHRLPNHPEFTYVESIYAHLHNVNVKAGDMIARGEQIGTIGTANGRYMAHLHLEMRDFINMSLGPGYSDDLYGYLDPSKFILENRP